MAIKHANSKQLKIELSKKIFNNIYLFLGEEEGDKDKIIDIITNHYFTNQEDRRNYTGRYNFENNEDFLSGVDFTLSSSMFSNHKVSILKNIDSVKISKLNKEILSDMVENLPESTTLIMTTGKNKIPSILLKSALKKIKTYIFWKLFDNELAGYAGSELKKNKIEIEPGLIQMLIELTGNNIKKVDEAIEVLKYSGEKIISKNILNNIIKDTKSTTVFEFIDLLFKKKKKSLQLLKKLIEDGIPSLQILYWIINQTQMMEKYYSYLEDKVSIDEAMGKSGVYGRKTQSFMQHINYYSSESVKKIFPLISAADLKIKSTSPSDNLLSNPIFELTSSILLL